MSRRDKKVINIFLLLIILLAQISPVFAADYAAGEEVKNLTNYLIENGVDADANGVLSDVEWAKVKNLNLYEEMNITEIEKAVNLESLEIHYCDISNIDFSDFLKLKKISIIRPSYIEEINLPEMNNLEELTINTFESENVSINISKLVNLKRLSLFTGNLKEISFPKFNRLEFLDIELTFFEREKNCELDLEKCKNVEGSLLTNGNLNLKLHDNIAVTDIGLRDISTLYIYKGHTIDYIEDYFLHGCEMEFEQNDVIELKGNSEIYGKNVGKQYVSITDVLGRKKTMQITVYETPACETSTELENSAVTAEIIDEDTILKSNGELWRINSEKTAEIIETNVKKSTSRYISDEVYMVSTLKNNNELKISYKDDGSKHKIIENVSDFNENAYLTTDNDLYQIEVNSITSEVSISNNKVLENVDKMFENYVILKDGSSYVRTDIYGLEDKYKSVYEKVSDNEISRVWIDTLKNYKKCLCYEDVEGVEWVSIDAVGTGFENGFTKLTSEMLLQRLPMTGGYMFDSGYIGIDNNYISLLKDEIVVSNVINNIYNSEYNIDVLVREDGTIWTYNDKNGLTKITKTTVSPEEPPVVEKDEYITNETIKDKEVGGDTVISGIGADNKVEDFIKENNFNNKYTVKVFDENNNVVASTEILGTGLTVKLYNEKNEVVKEYTVVIYGDTVGDGTIDAFDALTLIKGINNRVPFKGEVYKEAARIDVGSGEEPSAIDALLIVKAANNKYTINQSK